MIDLKKFVKKYLNKEIKTKLCLTSFKHVSLVI